MATVSAVTVREQNPATIAGVEVSSATYTGTNVAADLQYRWGRNAPLIQLVGTQTASRVYIGLDTDNAPAGAQVVIARSFGTVGTSIISLYSGAVGTGFIPGNEIAIIGNNTTATGQFLNHSGNAIVAFDGSAKVWR